MAKSSKAKTNGSKAVSQTQPRSLKAAENGVKTGHDFANLMSALMSDLIDGRVTPAIGNATCNAGGKLLKVVEMQYKYGTQGDGGGRRTLSLTLDNAEPMTPQLPQSV
jgi:hypothetical protein